jgi:2'-5' RNA ligase
MTEQPSRPEADQLLAHHNWRTDWTHDRPCLYWYLTFESQTELTSLFHRVEDELHRLTAVDVVPPSWLHLTLQEVGFLDEVSASHLDDLVHATASVAELLPLRLDLGPITTMTDAVVLRSHPSDELMALQSALAAGIESAPWHVPAAEPFWPHVTLAYTNRDCHRVDVMEALADVACHTTSVTVPRLTLAAVTRHPGHYRWSAVASLPVDGHLLF